MKPFEISGHWWLPFSMEKVPGILKFTHEKGLELNLIGTFYTGGSYRIIFGQTTEGKQITLCHSITLNHSRSLPYGSSQKVHSSIAYIGVHFEKEEDIHFNKAIFEYTHLSEWLQVSGFIKKLAKVPNIPKIEVSFDIPESLIAQTPKGKVTAGFNLSHDLIFLDSINLEQTADIEVEPSENISLEDLRIEFINPLGNLISLALDVRNSLTNLYVFNETVFICYEKDERTYTPIEVYFRTERPIKDKDTKTPQNRFFTLPDISDYKLTDKSLIRLKHIGVNEETLENLQKLKNAEFTNKADFTESLKKTIGDDEFNKLSYLIMIVGLDLQKAFNQVVPTWIQLAEEIPEVFKLFFSVLNSANKSIIDPERDFLKLAQAAETYHAEKIQDKQFLKDFEEKKKQFLETVPKSYKITEKSLEELKAKKLSQDILENLKDLKEKTGASEEDFLNTLQAKLGKEQTRKAKSLILKYAKDPNDLNEWAKKHIQNHGPAYRERIEDLYELNKSIIAPLVAGFKITDEALINLSNTGIPTELISKLEGLKNRILVLRQDFSIILHDLEKQGIINNYEQIKDLEELIIKHTYSIEDKDKFATDVVCSRNYYVHNDKRLREKAATSVEQLFPLYTALLFMLRACLMKEIGISEEKYKEFIIHNGKHIFAANEHEDKRIQNSW